MNPEALSVNSIVLSQYFIFTTHLGSEVPKKASLVALFSSGMKDMNVIMVDRHTIEFDRIAASGRPQELGDRPDTSSKPKRFTHTGFEDNMAQFFGVKRPRHFSIIHRSPIAMRLTNPPELCVFSSRLEERILPSHTRFSLFLAVLSTLVPLPFGDSETRIIRTLISAIRPRYSNPRTKIDTATYFQDVKTSRSTDHRQLKSDRVTLRK